mmetsp:Transcript_28271/g.60208  ORF Transcript_28271/g.60208 Transcript_28271/m.60208 type:complete len:178 (+) Transcript_28271:34-567(+)
MADAQKAEAKNGDATKSKLREAFKKIKKFDQDKNKEIDLEEFRAWMKEDYPDVPEYQVFDLFHRMDTDGNEQISEDEFAKIMEDFENKKKQEQESLKKYFFEGKAEAHKDRLTTVMKELGWEDLEESTIDAMVTYANQVNKESKAAAEKEGGPHADFDERVIQKLENPSSDFRMGKP